MRKDGPHLFKAALFPKRTKGSALGPMNPAIPRFFRRLLLVVVAAVAVVYVSDYAFLWLRMVSNFDGSPTQTVTVYTAATTKSGKLEVFYERPIQEVCVR